jgi:hypothetical protein
MPKYGPFEASIVYSGRFDYKAFYDFFFNVIKANGYVVTNEAHSQKVRENAEKVKIQWEFERIVDDYTKFTIEVRFLIHDLTQVIVKKEGGEVKLNEGKIDIHIAGSIITDWQKLWEKNFVLEKLRGFYERYLFRSTREQYEVEVYKDVYLIENELKSFLQLPRFM